MKTCAYCGLDNSDEATQCRGCGKAEWIDASSTPEPPPPWEKIAVLEYEVEAEHLAAELTTRNIPHMMKNYHDSALDGLFQLSQGWGHVEAPSEYKGIILEILKEFRDAPTEE